MKKWNTKKLEDQLSIINNMAKEKQGVYVVDEEDEKLQKQIDTLKQEITKIKVDLSTILKIIKDAMDNARQHIPDA